MCHDLITRRNNEWRLEEHQRITLSPYQQVTKTYLTVCWIWIDAKIIQAVQQT